MRRISVGIITLAIAAVFAAPLTASAASLQEDMFREQVASQATIGALLSVGGSGSDMNAIYFRTVYKSHTKVAIRIAAHMHNGARIPGVLILRKSAGMWYVSTITRGDSSAGVSMVPMPEGITSSVVNHAISEQADNQRALTGLITGGYKKLTVESRASNLSTRRLNVLLSRGYRKGLRASVYAYSKAASDGTSFWFINAIK